MRYRDSTEICVERGPSGKLRVFGSTRQGELHCDIEALIGPDHAWYQSALKGIVAAEREGDSVGDFDTRDTEPEA